jgi:hypothetical protein
MIGYVTANDDLIYFLSYLISNIPTYYDKKMSIFYVICMTKKRRVFYWNRKQFYVMPILHLSKLQNCICLSDLTCIFCEVTSQVKSKNEKPKSSPSQVINHHKIFSGKPKSSRKSSKTFQVEPDQVKNDLT